MPDLNHEALFQAFVAEIQVHVPDFKLRYKDESFLMKTLGFLMKPINPTFMTGYTTTIGSTVYYTSRSWVRDHALDSIAVLAHEFVHMWDHQKAPPLVFKLKYLFPQILALPALVLAIVLPFVTDHFLWIIPLVLGLVALAPWPSPTRTELELRGYGMTIACIRWLLGSPPTEAYRLKIREQFLGPSYYYMCRDAEKIDTAVAALTLAAEVHATEKEKPYDIVHDFFAKHGALR